MKLGVGAVRAPTGVSIGVGALLKRDGVSYRMITDEIRYKGQKPVGALFKARTMQ